MKTVSKLREDGSPAGGAPGMSTPNATPPSPANKTGDTPNMAMPPTAKPGTMFRRYRQFDVESATFRKFQNGRTRFERWSKYLDLNNENDKSLYDYAFQNRGREHLIVIRDSSTGAMRAIRHLVHRR